jgi:hypothetical protein
MKVCGYPALEEQAIGNENGIHHFGGGAAFISPMSRHIRCERFSTRGQSVHPILTPEAFT